MQPEQARIDTFVHADRHAARRKGGLGCAWHDEAYWNCLLDPADWKKSDPCDETGPLPTPTGRCRPASWLATRRHPCPRRLRIQRVHRDKTLSLSGRRDRRAANSAQGRRMRVPA
uniref:hypothetical protein n=1 Tax=unclassified Variovorax TaxID=663243 RepID=UPI0010524440